MHRRSKPIPVSICLSGNDSKDPLAFLLYCMKTKFQISTTCGWSAFTNDFPSTFAFSSAERISTWISLHGPQGPWSPISQKLSFLFPIKILSSEMKDFHKSYASVSIGKLSPSSPSNTVTYRMSFSIP